MQHTGRSRRWLWVAGLWACAAVFGAINDIVQRRLNGAAPPNWRDLLWSGGDWFIYALVTPAVFWVAARKPLVPPTLARRVLLHLAVSLVFCVAWAVGGKLLQGGLAMLVDANAPGVLRDAAGRERIALDVVGWIFTTLPFGIVVYFAMVGLAHAVMYLDQARQREVELARLSEQLAGARLATLQAQLNPHFLFNALNTIAVRARDGDGAGTAQLVERLSAMLRQTLAPDRPGEAALREELDLVRQYLSIEEARFSDRLRTSVVIPLELLDALVPSFSLQHLVENAIRHGIAQRTEAGALAIAGCRRGDSLELTVTDDGPGFGSGSTDRPGHGLANTRERLQALYGGRATLTLDRTDTGHTVAKMVLPLRWRSTGVV